VGAAAAGPRSRAGATARRGLGAHRPDRHHPCRAPPCLGRPPGRTSSTRTNTARRSARYAAARDGRRGASTRSTDAEVSRGWPRRTRGGRPAPGGG
jgi:hypothetical protein